MSCLFLTDIALSNAVSSSDVKIVFAQAKLSYAFSRDKNSKAIQFKSGNQILVNDELLPNLFEYFCCCHSHQS